MNAHQLVLSVGTNVDHEHNMRQAFDLLYDTFGECQLSPVYKSQPLFIEIHGKTKSEMQSQLDSDLTHAVEADKNRRTPIAYYYNNIVQYMTSDSVDDVKKKLKDIETYCERDRKKFDLNGRPVVSVDLDLLLYGDCTDMIPHKDILSCAYVLRPLADLLPEMIHPVEQKSFSQLWHDFSAHLSDEQTIDPVDFVWRDNIVSIAPPCVAM